MKDLDWDIKSRSNKCMICEKPFEDREAFFTTLVRGQDGYERTDCCQACRDKAGHDGVSYWKGIYKKPPPPPEEPLKKENAEDLLRRLMEDEDPAHINTIYILAVMLERRRVFVEKDVQLREDGSKLRIYEHKKSGEAFVVPDPDLKLAELEHVQEEVVGMLEGRRPGEAEEDAEAVAASGEDAPTEESPADETSAAEATAEKA
jgi:hypothetical protein